MKIAVYGANGYQGKLTLAELARRDVDTVLVGRDAGRLEQAAEAVSELAGRTVGGAADQRRVAGTDDRDALAEAFRDCDAVINCAGPFTSSGARLVSAAISAGSHYTDTSGEQAYLKEIFDRFAEEAENAGVTVVPAATDGCVPADLIAHLLAEHIDPIAEITTIHLVNGGGGPSRGSLRSVLDSLDVIKAGGLTYQDGDWEPSIAPTRTSFTPPGHKDATALAPFPLTEVITIPRHVPVRRVQGLVEAEIGARLSAPIPPELIQNLPEGPSQEARDSQSFTYIIEAVGTDGETARGIIRGTDTYGTTAALAAETALRLVTDPTKSGVLTAAQAFDPADFLNGLAPYGLSWTVES
jgi:short subunit dehydrogenase-like uncharacterized protein